MELMFDIETLDTQPTAVVLSLGAILFNPDGTIVDRFYRALDIQAQLNAGRTVSQDTLLWWSQQSSNARDEAFSPVRKTVPSVLGEFYCFVGNSPHDNNVTKFWCNGPAFDGIILESLARDFNHLIPWRYNQLRDQRTLVDMANFRVADHNPDIIGTPHTPIYDCEFQISVITACRNKLKNR